MASPKIHERIKKLLALATSPEANEAASAREQAEQLMQKHGLTLADFEEDVVEVVDDKRDELRLRLAKAVGISRRCSSITNKRGQIAFRGKLETVKSASEQYRSLVSDVTGHCEIGPRDPGRDVWRLCYWMGFVDAVIERLVDDEARSWIPPEPTKKQKTEAQLPPIQSLENDLVRATHQFASHFLPEHREMGVNGLRSEAYARGHDLGCYTKITSRERASSNRALKGQS